MPDIVKCDTCNGQGNYEALINIHDDITETVKCKTCDGKGVIYQMTEEAEEDVRANLGILRELEKCGY